MKYIIFIAVQILMLLSVFSASAKEYIVDANDPKASDKNTGEADQPFKTISKAAEIARAGDTVLVNSGVYRESVILKHNGTRNFPVTFLANPAGSVTITGADVISSWEKISEDTSIYQTEWEHQFIINRKKDGTPIEHHPEDAPVWGRAEQVIVDGYHLVPIGSMKELKKACSEMQEDEDQWSMIPDPDDAKTWYGVFFADTTQKALYICLSDSSDPNEHKVEASARGLIFGTNPWMNREGVQNIHVRGFTFRHGATFPQRAAVWLHGKDNIMENCLIEEMAGSGANVSGIMRRCIVRKCGQTGGGAGGDGFINEDCIWENNCWKPINRGWDAGGFKMARVDGGIFRRCIFRQNGGPGLWLDIHVRNVLITECIFQENELSGLFMEISRDITVQHNLSINNGLKAKGHSWSCGGIQIAESQNCIIAYNTCVGNKDGITFREQGPRVLDTQDYGKLPYYNKGNTVIGNVCAFNKDYQLGLWYDNAFFGWHPAEKEKYKAEEAYQEYLKTIPDKIYDPTKHNMIIDRNIYYAGEDQNLILYGVSWRPEYIKFDNLDEFSKHTGFDVNSKVADPMFIDADTGDYRFKIESPAWDMQSGWLMIPEDLDSDQ
ncbi:DUF1565 domain-containing protein [Candidatus Poribacteria bacterium]|nr:DUF1565 domain-containing protein [Candidatus Poribacteria bacterium]